MFILTFLFGDFRGLLLSIGFISFVSVGVRLFFGIGVPEIRGFCEPFLGCTC